MSKIDGLNLEYHGWRRFAFVCYHLHPRIMSHSPTHSAQSSNAWNFHNRGGVIISRSCTFLFKEKATARPSLNAQRPLQSSPSTFLCRMWRESSLCLCIDTIALLAIVISALFGHSQQCHLDNRPHSSMGAYQRLHPAGHPCPYSLPSTASFFSLRSIIFYILLNPKPSCRTRAISQFLTPSISACGGLSESSVTSYDVGWFQTAAKHIRFR